MTKSIIVLGALALFACSSDEEPDPAAVTNAPIPTNEQPSEAKTPTAKRSDLANGVPGVETSNPATTFVPLLDWSFESASPDCNGWPVVGSNAAIRAIPAKTGSYSCKVCSNGSSHDLAVSRGLGTVAKGSYTLSAYVRKRALTAAPSQAIAQIHGKTVTTSDPVDVREEWQRVQTFIQLDEDTSDLSISIGSANAEADHCLFVDDVVFTRNY